MVENVVSKSDTTGKDRQAFFGGQGTFPFDAEGWKLRRSWIQANKKYCLVNADLPADEAIDEFENLIEGAKCWCLWRNVEVGKWQGFCLEEFSGRSGVLNSLIQEHIFRPVLFAKCDLSLFFFKDSANEYCLFGGIRQNLVTLHDLISLNGRFEGNEFEDEIKHLRQYQMIW